MNKVYELKYILPEEFISNSYKLSLENNENIEKVKSDIISSNYSPVMFFRNDRYPTYYTSIDDEIIMVDSYNKDEIYNYIIIYASKTPEFLMEDNFIPDIPQKVFPYFLSEVKSVCFNTVKQAPNAKEEQRSRRQRIWLSREKWRTQEGIIKPNYGRK